MSQITKYYLALDIEKAGDRFCDDILMIGCCLGDVNGKVIESKAFCGPIPKPEEFDQRCWTEFWLKNLDILERIREVAKQNGVDTKEKMIDNFMDYYYELDNRFGPFTRAGPNRLILLTDNPTYDISAIDQALVSQTISSKNGLSKGNQYTFPLRYTKTGQYNRVEDPSERANGLPVKKSKEIMTKVKEVSVHDHWAENDAIGIYHWHMEVLKAAKAQK